MLGGRSAFDSAIRLAGGQLVRAMEWTILQSAIIRKPPWSIQPGGTTLTERVKDHARRRAVPLLLDDAAGILPF